MSSQNLIKDPLKPSFLRNYTNDNDGSFLEIMLNDTIVQNVGDTPYLKKSSYKCVYHPLRKKRRITLLRVHH